jgi:hypothetical protein
VLRKNKTSDERSKTNATVGKDKTWRCSHDIHGCGEALASVFLIFVEVPDPPPDVKVRRTHHLSEIIKDMVIERIKKVRT